ncbi:MAG TPA: response regulator, partial [Bacteroidetes bacterium]|nr:response regulator [Bacteroidota bacterium]HEX04831.1 response regulator [Bacteroidota bacterium]
AKDALLASEAKFRNVIEQSNDAIYIIYESRFVLMNKRFTAITGITEEDTAKADFNFLDSVAVESKQLILDRAEMWERGEQPSSVYEFAIAKSNGECIQVQASVSQIDYENGKAYLGILRDITEYKELEAQLRQSQKMESIGRLAGGVAHDFNNILTVILGNLELAMLKLDPVDPLYKDLSEIEVAANRSADLTRQLLGFARQQTVAPKVLDLNIIITNMMNILNRLIGEDIELAWMPGENLWNVRIDPTQMDQILANMAVNARDAIDGVGKLTVETGNVSIDEDSGQKYPEPSTGEYVVTTVSDNGSGMEKYVLDNLFEPFFTTKDLGEGTGLGLATVFGIIKQNDGFIDVASEPGEGTTFKIHLPRFKGEAESAGSFKERGVANVGNETILIVEDELSILKLGVKLLTGLGYKVHAANSPKEAIQLSADSTTAFDLLITDVVMPEMNGKELAQQLLATNSGMKVLFMSGYTADVIAHHGILKDGLNFLQKPFSLIELSSNVRGILDS